MKSEYSASRRTIIFASRSRRSWCLCVIHVPTTEPNAPTNDPEIAARAAMSPAFSGCELLESQTYLTQLRGDRHRKACRMCGSQQFFGVGTDTIFKSRTERILRVLQDSALCR